MTAGSGFRLNNLSLRQYPAAVWLCIKCRSWTLKVMARAGHRLMDGSSTEVMLCVPDESSESQFRIYETMDELPLHTILSL